MFQVKITSILVLGGRLVCWCLCLSHTSSWARLGLTLGVEARPGDTILASGGMCRYLGQVRKRADTLMQVHWWRHVLNYVSRVTLFCSFFLISNMGTLYRLKAGAAYIFSYLEPSCKHIHSGLELELLTWAIHLQRHSHKFNFQPCLPDRVKADFLKMGTIDCSYWTEEPVAIINTTAVQAKLNFNILFFTHGFANENWTLACLLGSILQIPIRHTKPHISLCATWGHIPSVPSISFKCTSSFSWC